MVSLRRYRRHLTKPFGVRELVARARALLRRPRQGAAEAQPSAGQPGDVLRIRGIEIDVPRRRVTSGGRDVDLTDQEFRLLHLLATHPGIVFSREALLSRIWRGDTYVTVRSVDTLVKRLRRRIEDDPANPAFVQTVWGGDAFRTRRAAGKPETHELVPAVLHFRIRPFLP